MSIEVKVPVLPESVSDATIATWHKKVGDAVKRDENLVDLETDKVVLEVPATVDGVLKQIIRNTGDTVGSQELIGIIEAGAVAAATPNATAETAKAPTAMTNASAPQAVMPSPPQRSTGTAPPPGPAANRVIAENNLNASSIVGSGRAGQVTKEDALIASKSPAPAANNSVSAVYNLPSGERSEQRVAMTRMRLRIAERMMQSKNSIAMLTSSNEVNMKAVMDCRKSFGEAFEKANGIRLGVMSFFAKAAAEALKRYPIVNASVDGNDVIYHSYADISIAVATEKGLVTPVLRNVENMSFADIEKAIAGYAKQAREGGLKLEDLQGGTFTITNGGVFGSLFSTPIVNPPQSAILGMHTIKDRAIVENGAVIAAPMMYIALSYDHRIIDGKDAVQFLVDIKNQLENPQRMLLGL